jgi:hypothetical protein
MGKTKAVKKVETSSSSEDSSSEEEIVLPKNKKATQKVAEKNVKATKVNKVVAKK